MKILRNCLSATLAFLALATLSSPLSTALAQGTAFTYQGQLANNGQPASGSYDLTFALFNGSGGAGQLGGAITNSAVTVSNGLFTVALDFGSQFAGADRWLEIGVRTNGGGAFSTLAPRQKVLPTPYAIYSANAGSAATATTAGSATSATTAISANSATTAGSALTAGTAASAATATTAGSFTGSLSGDVTGTQGATAVAKVGGQTAANVAGGASAANAATSANTPNTIVKRDGSGMFPSAR